ncbi:MAG: FAD-dependent oxidoreductase [Smithellaceae bacterium]|nr:FAD-dependent oxidoreductase [Smithellaceae bacterium]
MNPLPLLFSPVKIGSLEIKNRLVMAPMATDYANDDGTVSQRLIDYHEARAQGGVGLITLEVTTIDGDYPYIPHTVGLWDDSFIEGMKTLTDTVHRHGAKIVPQVAHPGPESLSPLFTDKETLGPSAGIRGNITKMKCRGLTVAEIEEIIEKFGETARRAKEAGCDGIELHAAHSYMLVGSFMSALRNRRTDAYGGSVDARLKFPREVLACIRAKVGEDFPIIMRISGDDLVHGGRDLRETLYIAPLMVAAGVNAFHVSSGVYPDMSWRVIPPTGTPLALNTAFSRALKEVVDVPVMVVGRINDPRLAEDILRRSEADMIVMGRALLADPELPNKATEGRFEDIAPCVACGIGCVAAREEGLDMTCVVNPVLGREKEMELLPAARKKKVMVIGGGPGGLEVARVAALRGHEVALYEKADQPGGQLLLAAVPPGKQEIVKMVKYLRLQAEKAGVALQLDTEVDGELIAGEKPDAVVIATGAQPCHPDIPGIDGPNILCAHEVLAGLVDCGPGKVLIIGGGMVGCELADFIADQGDNITIGRTEVTIIEMLDEAGQGMFTEARTLLMARLREKGVTILTSATVKEFLDDGVVVDINGEEKTLSGIDAIVLAMGAKPVDALADTVGEVVAEVHVVGDAKRPRRALEAMAEAAEIGRVL